MSTVSGTINHSITLGTSGVYASPLTVAVTGAVSNNGTGDAVYGPDTAAWTVVNAGLIAAPSAAPLAALVAGALLPPPTGFDTGPLHPAGSS